MHDTSYNSVKAFLETIPNEKLKIVDVGSAAVENQVITYRELIKSEWEYTGIDVVDGLNVDIVVEPYKYPFKTNSVDVIISGSTMEHCADLGKWFKEMYRILKPDGRIFINAPSSGPEHWRPDYWRVLPDGLRYLMEQAGFKEIDTWRDLGTYWCDVNGKAIK